MATTTAELQHALKRIQAGSQKWGTQSVLWGKWTKQAFIGQMFSGKDVLFLRAQILSSSHTYRSTNITCQCLVPIFLSSLSPRHPDSSSLLLCIFSPLVKFVSLRLQKMDFWMVTQKYHLANSQGFTGPAVGQEKHKIIHSCKGG